VSDSDRAVNTIITLHFNESLNSNKNDWQLLSLKNRQTCSKSLHLYCSKYLPPALTQACRCWCHLPTARSITAWFRYALDSFLLKIMGHTIATSFWDRCCFLTSVWHLEASFSAGQCPITSCQWHSSAAGVRDARFYPTHSLAAWLTGPQPGGLQHVECASGASLLYQDLRGRRNETTHQRVGRSESRCYWMCCCRVAPTSTRLRLRWRRTFRAYDVKMMWLTTCLKIFERQ